VLGYLGFSESINNLTKLEMDYWGKNTIISIGLDPGYIKGQLTDVFFDMLILLIVVLLASFEIILILLRSYVAHPISNLDEVLKRQASGDFSFQNTQLDKDEVNQLTWSMNQHAKQLQHSSSALYEKFSQQQETTKSSRISALLNRLQTIIAEHNLFVKKPDAKNNGGLIDVRIPLFMFVFAEELQKSFMPLFVNENYSPIPYLSPEIAIGLPISIFMFVIAVVTPFGSALTNRFGNKTIFLAGLIPAIIGYLGCAFADSFMMIIISRAITATGYAVIVISSQGYIASTVSPGKRVVGMAVFIGVVMSSSMCGTAIGGILADRIGFNNVFIISAVFSFVAGVLAWKMLKNKPISPKKQSEQSSMMAIFTNKELALIIGFSAIPAKIILTGFLYYLVPIALSDLDASAAEIGRIMMVYPLLIIPLSPLIASKVDQYGASKLAVVIGSVGSGLSLVVFHNMQSIHGLLVMIVLVSISHSFMKAALIATTIEAAEKTDAIGTTAALGLLRTIERIGSVFGPILVATLLSFFSVANTMLVIGLLVAGLGTILYLGIESKASPNLSGAV
jgi:predicted MFS family arabinose efflux permease